MYAPHTTTWRCLTVQAILYYAHFLFFSPFSFSLRYKGKNEVPENGSLGVGIYISGWNEKKGEEILTRRRVLINF